MDKMVVFKCKACGNTYYPKRSVCPACHGREFEKVELEGECTLLTYTELYATPLGIERRALVLGIVEFEGGIRATGQIRAEKLEIGMRLRPAWDKTRTVGFKELYGLVFEPI